MSYVHCHGCGWTQDDFWDKDYNPIAFLFNMFGQDILTKDLDELMKNGTQGNITRREWIAQQLEIHANLIRKQKYRTFEELQAKNREGICPNCGKLQLDID